MSTGDNALKEYIENLKVASFGCPYSRILSNELTVGGDIYKPGSVICKQRIGMFFDEDFPSYSCQLHHLVETERGLESQCSWNSSRVEFNVTNFEFGKE